jgi:hypothetical protein
LPSAETPVSNPFGVDIEAVLAVPTGDPNETEYATTSNTAVQFTWNYEQSRPGLTKLYEKAKRAQWNANDLPWDTPVDPEALAVEAQVADTGADLSHTPLAKWGPAEWARFDIESRNWTLSQFLHGEQGALICAARITETVPWIDAKYYAATQAMDEARHVEVFARYLDEKLGSKYPISPHLRALLEDIITDSRWDVTYLGMQVVVEGLALAAFGALHQLTTEPLLKQLLRQVLADEARHVAFGVLSLQEVYAGLSDAELRERQEFCYEASIRMRDRMLQQEVWERLGVDPRVAVPLTVSDPKWGIYQSLLFSKIVPNCKKLGLLDASGGWLRKKYAEMGVIQYEDWPSGDEPMDLESVGVTTAA